MKLKTVLGLSAAVVLCAVIARPLWSDDEGSGAGGKKDGGEDAAKAAEMMKPGPEHKELAKLAGKWDVSGKFWMGTPDDGKAVPGTAEFKVILDGRYIQQDFTGTFMGQPYTGMGVMGYDRYMKHYTNYWSDSVSTMPMFLFGTTTDGGKTIEFPGEMPDGKGGVAKYRTVMTTKSADSFTYEMFEPYEGKEMKAMELTYTRKK